MRPIRLYDYQQDILEQIRTSWLTCKSVMVQMPTGTGKTHVLAAVTEGFLDKGCVWIVAHRRELVSQIKETLEKYGISRDDGRIKTFSIQWLFRNPDAIDRAPGLIIIDEAHHALAESYTRLWERFPEAKKLGMTATPCRMNRKGFTGLFDRLVTSWEMIDFIRKGRLAPYDYVTVESDSKELHLLDLLEKRGADGDFQTKELDEVFNRRVPIMQLYDSLMKYAGGKKGIVYAIDISHARNIAEYYSSKGLRTVAIDSRTPPARRKELVGGFKRGALDVLVNVDIFSEGFDCPDVEFVQMARPTLSLAKYLQQAGRGLRVSEGKEKCILIDNVGLYRIFGLPTDVRDWRSMFLGLQAGKGMLASKKSDGKGAAVFFGQTEGKEESPEEDAEMVVVMESDQLLETMQGDSGRFEGFRQGSKGLWRLRNGGMAVYGCSLKKIISIKGGYAVAKRPDNSIAVIDKAGKEIPLPEKTVRVTIGRTCMAELSLKDGNKAFLDLKSGKQYRKRPIRMNFIDVELLFSENVCHSRTRHLYEVPRNCCRFTDRGYYLLIKDSRSLPPEFPYRENIKTDGNAHYICLLLWDYTTFYYLCKELPDGSIVIMDGREGIYYHVGKYLKKVRLSGAYSFSVAELEEKIRQRMAGGVLENSDIAPVATPFRSGDRWGLKLGNKIVCPPLFKKVCPPVGEYCAFENSSLHWGVLGIDGHIRLEAVYSAIKLYADGTADVTLTPEVVKTVRIPQ